jgi:hypothetical protein
MVYLYPIERGTVTYDHRLKRIGHPVRSAIHKLEIGGLVVGWVTTSEYPLLYVFFCLLFIFCSSAEANIGRYTKFRDLFRHCCMLFCYLFLQFGSMGKYWPIYQIRGISSAAPPERREMQRVLGRGGDGIRR